MAKSRHSGAFIIGSVLGGAVGALAALWNTPQSGEDLRRKLGLESGAAPEGTPPGTAGDPGQPDISLAGKVIGLVESAAAPLVGVKLGQTANNSQPGQGKTTLTSIQ